MDHFKLDPLAKTTLALAFKAVSKPDLKTKGTIRFPFNANYSELS
jgi:CCR4-NOT transcription complex subunit 1